MSLYEDYVPEPDYEMYHTKPSAKVYDPKETSRKTHWELNVVGESFYKDDKPAMLRHDTFTLVPEPGNPHDLTPLRFVRKRKNGRFIRSDTSAVNSPPNGAALPT